MNPDLLAQLRARLTAPADVTRVTRREPVTPPSEPPVRVVPLRPVPMPLDSAVARAADIVAKEEQFRPQAYLDRHGKGHPWTVGYGKTGPDVGPSTVVTEPEARDWMKRRILRDALSLQQAGIDPHPAVLSFMYNVGPNAVLNNTELADALRSGDSALAANLMSSYVYGRKRDNPKEREYKRGLARRRINEIATMQDVLQQQLGDSLAATRLIQDIQARIHAVPRTPRGGN